MVFRRCSALALLSLVLHLVLLSLRLEPRTDPAGMLPSSARSANAIMMAWTADLIEGIATEALDFAEAWEAQRLAGWDRARTVIFEIVIDANMSTDMLGDILERERTGEGHAVTDAELGMAQDHRQNLAMRVRLARRAMEGVGPDAEDAAQGR